MCVRGPVMYTEERPLRAEKRGRERSERANEYTRDRVYVRMHVSIYIYIIRIYVYTYIHVRPI